MHDRSIFADVVKLASARENVKLVNKNSIHRHLASRS
jgi:hypothetical protein